SGDLARVAGTHTGSVSSTIAYDARTGVRDQSFNPYMAGDIGGWGVPLSLPFLTTVCFLKYVFLSVHDVSSILPSTGVRPAQCSL
ncbi:MAG: hypothetical protein AAF330_01890, partial [Pseudomonadota bacterium]